jgi:RHS repeat-associated protein
MPGLLAQQEARICVEWLQVQVQRQQHKDRSCIDCLYDANGNTLSDASGRSYTWDFESRLVSMIVPGTGSTAFKYDPFGRRIQKSGPLGTTNYLYDGFNLLVEVDQSGNVLARYAPTRNLDEPLSEWRSGTTNYYQQDRLGSATSLSNSAGAVAKTYTFDSFGKLTASTGALTNPFEYTGREFDSETGLLFNRARYYDPQVGRFLSEDPIRFRGGANFYAYTRNNPVVLIDPLGYQGCNAEQWAQSPHACAGPQDPDAPYQGQDGLWYNVPEWRQPDPTPPLPSSAPAIPTTPPQPNACHHANDRPSHDCALAYVETAIGGGWIVGFVAVDGYLLLPAAFEESGLEGLMLAFGHGAATIPAVPGALLYVDGIKNITRDCPLIVDWFIGPGN